MKEGPREEIPAQVPAEAKQAGEVRARWAWTEPSVWTERMLEALERGVKGGKWFSLIDKVYVRGNLEAAFRKVKANKGSAGVDQQTISMFERQLEENLGRLEESLREGRYRPQPIRRAWIPKPGRREKRPLGIPTVRDRVGEAALKHVLEPIFERDFAEQSYGFRPGRGAKDALRRVDGLLKKGHVYVVEADIKGYYDTIPQDRLLRLIEEKVADGRVLKLIGAYLERQVVDLTREWTPEEGVPQGSVIGPLLANIYLDPLDKRMAGGGWEMVRYADDLVVLCRNREEAERVLEELRGWMKEAGLELHPEKTRIVDHRERGGFDFLGYHFERGYRWPSRKSLGKLKDAVRSKTKRCNGHSLDTIIKKVNRTLVGWFEYFKHSHYTTWRSLDAWVRMRLRSILRKRAGCQGRGRGMDHQRWPIDFFAGCGLFSLTVAHAAACQSARR